MQRVVKMQAVNNLPDPGKTEIDCMVEVCFKVAPSPELNTPRADFGAERVLL